MRPVRRKGKIKRREEAVDWAEKLGRKERGNGGRWAEPGMGKEKGKEKKDGGLGFGVGRKRNGKIEKKERKKERRKERRKEREKGD